MSGDTCLHRALSIQSHLNMLLLSVLFAAASVEPPMVGPALGDDFVEADALVDSGPFSDVGVL